MQSPRVVAIEMCMKITISLKVNADILQNVKPFEFLQIVEFNSALLIQGCVQIKKIKQTLVLYNTDKLIYFTQYKPRFNDELLQYFYI